jgi:thioredoxin-like negative regulator of GroEL
MIERLLIGRLMPRPATPDWDRLLLARRARASSASEYRIGTPAILYFTSPGCAPCQSVQSPALERLRRAYRAGVQVLEVDATRQPHLADAWGVLSVPTTFLIDADGRPRAVNHGVARFERLHAQLIGLGYPPPAPEPSQLESANAD